MPTNLSRILRFVTMLAIGVAAAVSLEAKTTTATSTGNWTAAIWDNGAPVAGDIVIIGSGATVTLSATPPAPASLTVAANATLTFDQDIAADLTVAGNLTVALDGTIVCNRSSLAGEGAGRVITVTGNADISGLIDGVGKGFPMQQGPGFVPQWPAAHGGRADITNGGFGAIYGAPDSPTSLGSGSYQDQGGGAVKLDVGGTATIDGMINCNPTDPNPHGASGGSIWILADTLAGSGTLSARGGDGAWGRAGGGGRIALDYNTSTYSGTINLRGGFIGSTWNTHGQPGSLWDPARFATAAATIVLNGDKYQYFFDAPLGGNYTWALSAINGADVYFHDFSGATMTLTSVAVSGGSTLRFDVGSNGLVQQTGVNSLAFAGGLAVSGSSVLAFAEGTPSAAAVPISVTGSSTLYLHADDYVVTDLTIGAGSSLYVGVGDTTAVNAASGGSGGNPHGTGITMVCGSATIDGLLDMTDKGFLAPSGGPGGATNFWDGGGYGGEGGAQTGLPSGLTYGSLTKPSALGSGSKYAQGDGGGAIKLDVDGPLAIDGAIRADAGAHSNYGGGSGGSIWLVAQTLSGTGTIAAVGGHGNPSGSHGGGGGGRIAIDFVSSSFGGSVNLAGGVSASSAVQASEGTLFQSQGPNRAMSSNGYGGISVASTFGTDHGSDGIKVARSISQWTQDDVEWTEVSTDLSGTPVANTADYLLTGLAPNTTYNVHLDTVLVYWNDSAGDGSFSITGLPITSTSVLVTKAPTANQDPLAACQDITVCAGDPVAPSAVDDGSTDPDNDPITLSLTPPGPYADGTHTVTLTVEDDQGATDTCTATITAQGISVPRLWNGTGDWYGNPENWFPCPPVAGGIAIIQSGTVTLSSAPPVLADLTVAADAVLTFTAGQSADIAITGNLLVETDGTIVCTPSSFAANAGTGAGRAITVGGNATIDGRIDADGQGFPLQQGPGFVPQWPAAHGGRADMTDGGLGLIYGSVDGPVSLGSGSYQDQGGGAVLLDVDGTLTVAGAISANPTDPGPHGAAGGSIWIIADALAGSGTLSARGGDGPWGRAGGGGRIALDYGSSSFAGAIVLRGGYIGSWGTHGQPGSLWEPQRFATAVAAIVLDDQQFQYFFPAPMSTNYDWSVTATNGSDVYFHDFSGATMSLNNIDVNGGSALRFDIDDAGLRFQTGVNDLALTGGIGVAGGSTLALAEGTPSATAVPLSLSGSSTLYLHIEDYVLSTLDIEAGSELHVGRGDTTTVNGTGIRITADSAVVDGLLEMAAKGFLAPGGGPGGTAIWWNGGGHGGEGGAQSGAPTGLTYGSLTQPQALGSGAAYAQGDGGGAVLLDVATTLQVDGTITVAGGAHSNYGGGSGGSIWLIADSFSGSGTLSADGGHGNPSGSHGGGGGGRIAIEYISSTFSGTSSVAGGASAASAVQASPGSVFTSAAPYRALSSAGGAGITIDSAFAVDHSSTGLKLSRTVSQWSQLALEWTDDSADLASVDVSNSVNYQLDGLLANSDYNVYRNAVLLGTYTTGPTGALAVNGIALSAATVLVEFANVAPEAACQDISVALGSGGSVTVAGAAVNDGSSDADGDPLTFTLAPNTFTCAELGANAVTLTVDDGQGGSDTCTATVTVTSAGSCADLQTAIYNGLCTTGATTTNYVELLSAIDAAIATYLNGGAICDALSLAECRDALLTALGVPH